MTIAFSAEKSDALQEIVNVGMGTAAGALATALGAFVELRVPRIEMVAPERLVELLFAGPWGQRDFACIRQGFFGQLMGESLMLLHGVSHARLAALLGHAEAPPSAIDEEMLLDIANAVMGACVGGIADALEESVSFSPPCSLGSRAETEGSVARRITSWRRVLLVDVDFRLEDRQFESRVLVFLNEESVDRIDHALNRLLDSLVA